MTFERDEYRDLVKKQQQKVGVQRRASHLHLIEQAAVEAKYLTGDRHWDVFLQQIAYFTEEVRKQREGAARLLADPNVVSTDALLRAKIAVIECDARIQAWEAVIALPKQLIEQGEIARDVSTDSVSDSPNDAE